MSPTMEDVLERGRSRRDSGLCAAYSSVRRDRIASSLQRPNAHTGDDRGETLIGTAFGDSGELYARHDREESGGLLGASEVPFRRYLSATKMAF
jgi:hypothetical protein